jgi:hypothetical protein
MTRCFLFLSLASALFGCRASADGADAPPAEMAVHGDLDSWYAVGFSPGGAVVVFDPASGAELSRTAGGGGRARDVVVDPAGSIWVIEENEDASGAEVLRCGLAAASIGPCLHAAWVDGAAMSWADPAGLWVFEDGPAGSRFKVLRDGYVAEGVAAPRPSSIWPEPNGIGMLSYGANDDTLERLSVTFGALGIVIEKRPVAFGKPLGFPPTTRFVPTSAEGGLLWDVSASDVALRRVHAGAASGVELLGVAPFAPRIEAAAALSGRAEGAVFVASTERAWAVREGSDGALEVAEVELSGSVRRSISFFSRDLLVLGARAFVATDRGVRAFDVETADTGLRAFRDERFDGDALRGPLGVFRHHFAME